MIRMRVILAATLLVLTFLICIFAITITNSFCPELSTSVESKTEASSILISEDDAIDLLHSILEDNNLHYSIMGSEEYLGLTCYSVKAFYDEGDHITTQGFYLVSQYSNDIYKQNMLDNGYEKIN